MIFKVKNTKLILNFKSKVDIASLALRISVGTVFLLHGIGKALVVGMAQVNQGFQAHGFPIWTNYFATSIEIMAGIFLAIGFFGRLASLILIPITIGIIIYHFPNGWVFQNAGGGWEYPQLILISLITIFFLGSGKYSLNNK